jgi:hypothetical protein
MSDFYDPELSAIIGLPIPTAGRLADQLDRIIAEAVTFDPRGDATYTMSLTREQARRQFWDPLTGKADHFWAYTPAPIYDSLVAEIIQKHEGAANAWYERGEIAAYARLITLADRIRQKVVPPWTPLDIVRSDDA